MWPWLLAPREAVRWMRMCRGHAVSRRITRLDLVWSLPSPHTPCAPPPLFPPLPLYCHPPPTHTHTHTPCAPPPLFPPLPLYCHPPPTHTHTYPLCTATIIPTSPSLLPPPPPTHTHTHTYPLCTATIIPTYPSLLPPPPPPPTSLYTTTIIPTSPTLLPHTPPPPPPPPRDRLVGLVVRRPPRARKIPGSNPACAGIFGGRVIPVTKKLALHWLPCQAPGVIGSALGLVGPVSVYCDWVR